ncbi:uncharacterized protein LOC105010019 isoform X2 [Esox lucius]|uniref:uncharacterized protein LOC105010019 isoform X2 n=1 Tax=Esox lucius TaxID=8010 RepID=UPI0010BD103C|nr:uncharacterized protein LOC105010019 isoform X2 [Esox lucius]
MFLFMQIPVMTTQQALQRLKCRMELLKKHHSKCESRMEKRNREEQTPDTDVVSTSKEMEDGTESGSRGHMFNDAPPLIRTDSVYLTKEMLGYDTDNSITSTDNSEDDYVPASSESSEEDSSAGISGLKRNKPKKDARKKCLIKRKEYNKTYEGHTSTPKDVSLSTETLVVLKVSQADGSKNYHKKKHFCLFCEEPQLKIARHLERKHSKEIEVASALRFAKNSKERRLHLNLLRKKGNRAHNIRVLKEGKGFLVPCKQTSNQDSNPEDYQHCFACYGLFKRKFMWKHAERCTLASKVRKMMPGKTPIQTLCASSQPVPKEVSEKLWKLVNHMNQDDIAHAIKEDRYIIALGEKMFNKKGENRSQHQHIRQTMRELGRLLISGRMVTPLKKMKDYINPKNFEYVIKAVKEVAGFNEETNRFGKATLATKLGQNIQKIADIFESEALIAQNEEKMKLVRDFRGIYHLRWNEMISAAAYRTLEQKKWNAPQLIPLADDVKKMHMYMEDDQKRYYEQLLSLKTSKNWSNLVQVILAQMIIFNRRRDKEVSAMTVATFLSRDKSPINPDVLEALTEVEKMLCKYFERIETRGKRDRKVPLLLTPVMVKSLELLVKERSSCGVGDYNIYLFARPGYDTHFRGSDCIRAYAKKCGAQQPKALSSTKLRKQVATLSRVLNLNDTEQDQFADFLGHDIRVHRKFYRLPEGTLQLAKISKILMACEQGRLTEFKGKSLDQISISPCETLMSEKKDDTDYSNLESESVSEKAESSEEESSNGNLTEMTAIGHRQSAQKGKLGQKSCSHNTAVSEQTEDTGSNWASGIHSDREESSDTDLTEMTAIRHKQSAPKGKLGRKSGSYKAAVSEKMEDAHWNWASRSDPDREESSYTILPGKTSAKQDVQPGPAKRFEKQSFSLPAKGAKQKWSSTEVDAVEHSLMDFIRIGKTPGKQDCERCISAFPQALVNRDWRAVKFYVRNRITADQRRPNAKYM